MIYERCGELNGREHRAPRSLQCENVIFFFPRYKIIIWVCFILTLLLVLTSYFKN